MRLVRLGVGILAAGFAVGGLAMVVFAIVALVNALGLTTLVLVVLAGAAFALAVGLVLVWRWLAPAAFARRRGARRGVRRVRWR